MNKIKGHRIAIKNNTCWIWPTYQKPNFAHLVRFGSREKKIAHHRSIDKQIINFAREH